MARKKVKLAFIVNNSLRKATYKKRKRGLLKKVHEISTLCGINAGAIIYSPYDPTPEVWPSVEGMNQVIAAFRNLPEIDRHNNMVNQREFIQQRITKADKLMRKQKKDNREVKLTEDMYRFLQMGQLTIPAGGHNDPSLVRDLNDLGYLVDQYRNSLNRRIQILEGGSDVEIGESSNVVAATAPATTVHGLGSSSSSAAAGASLFNQMSLFPQNQQQFHQPYAPYALRFYEQARNQSQSLEMMNMGYAANQMGFPFMGNAHHYHQTHHHQPQQPRWFRGESSTAPQQLQLFPGESSAVPPPATSGSVPPDATTQNPTNNIWFR
ncbi:Agamous-like MADS-box protein AGL80 [Raphanus sativus]|uniref:Agamous-like MADS-box protein AGL80 n=1 Tax=Raphanus sativus TaxID=3726 RepID=A0A6J0L7K9_RAPSA|nr:agamous-like MADS-box protein AGL80 [Raphanus sativus]KAJ4877898.1 Agamous-like MADS-box protein AGL80 [Raphanus sativus]